MAIIPKVAQKGGSFPLLTSTPLVNPIRAPKDRPANTANKGDPVLFKVPANITPHKPSIEPTERSIPPVKITKVSPAANIEITDTCLNTFKMLLTVKKAGVRKLKTNDNPISPITEPKLLNTLPKLV